MPQRVVEPINSILISGEPHIEEFEVETAANMYPGKLVILGTASHQVVVATDNSTGVIGVLDVMPTKTVSEMYDDTTTYSVGDQVRVLSGDITVRLRGDHADSISVGEAVQAAPDGNVDSLATANAKVGVAEDAHTGGAGYSDSWIIVHLTNV